MADTKLLYMVRDGFDYGELISKYGFYKTTPSNPNNPWYQIFLKTDWSSGFGFPLNGISINRDFGSVWLLDSEDVGEEYWKLEIQKMIAGGALVEVEELDRVLTDEDFAEIEKNSCGCTFHNEAGKVVAGTWYRRGASIAELSHALFPNYIW